MSRVNKTIDEYLSTYLDELERDIDAFKSSNQRIGQGSAVYKPQDLGVVWTGVLNSTPQTGPYKRLSLALTSTTQTVLLADISLSMTVNGVTRTVADYMNDGDWYFRYQPSGNVGSDTRTQRFNILIGGPDSTSTVGLSVVSLASDNVTWSVS